MVEGASDPVPTGWNSQDYDLVADPEQPPAGEHWNKAKRVDGSVSRKVHYDSIDPMTPELLNAALIDLGYITKA